MSQQWEYFLSVRRSPGTRGLGRRAAWFALIGPGLDPEGIPFVAFDDAVARGRAIAQSSGVALWDATSSEPSPTLIATFRR